MKRSKIGIYVACLVLCLVTGGNQLCATSYGFQDNEVSFFSEASYMVNVHETPAVTGKLAPIVPTGMIRMGSNGPEIAWGALRPSPEIKKLLQPQKRLTEKLTKTSHIRGSGVTAPLRGLLLNFDDLQVIVPLGGPFQSNYRGMMVHYWHESLPIKYGYGAFFLRLKDSPAGASTWTSFLPWYGKSFHEGMGIFWKVMAPPLDINGVSMASYFYMRGAGSPSHGLFFSESVGFSVQGGRVGGNSFSLLVQKESGSSNIIIVPNKNTEIGIISKYLYIKFTWKSKNISFFYERTHTQGTLSPARQAYTPRQSRETIHVTWHAGISYRFRVGWKQTCALLGSGRVTSGRTASLTASLLGDSGATRITFHCEAHSSGIGDEDYIQYGCKLTTGPFALSWRRGQLPVLSFSMKKQMGGVACSLAVSTQGRVKMTCFWSSSPLAQEPDFPVEPDSELFQDSSADEL